MDYAEAGRALDLGCGALRDSKFLAEHGYSVKAVDKSQKAREVYDEIEENIKDQISLSITDLTELELAEDEYELVNSQWTLHFLPPKEFQNFWQDMKESLSEDGVLAVTLLGPEDEWNKPENDMNFHTQEEVESLLSNMEIIRYEEQTREAEKADGESKYWHIHEVIAKK